MFLGATFRNGVIVVYTWTRFSFDWLAYFESKTFCIFPMSCMQLFAGPVAPSRGKTRKLQEQLYAFGNVKKYFCVCAENVNSMVFFFSFYSNNCGRKMNFSEVFKQSNQLCKVSPDGKNLVSVWVECFYFFMENHWYNNRVIHFYISSYVAMPRSAFFWQMLISFFLLGLTSQTDID